MQRMMRAAIGTHNIDNCSRVCHSPTSFALRKSFGMSGATGSFDDIEAADVALLIGVNPTQGHPVVGARIKQAAIKGLKLITADPRRIELADYGQLHLGMRPGTNAALLNGLAHVVIRDGLVTASSSPSAPRATRRSQSWSRPTRPRRSRRSRACPAADLVARRAPVRDRRARLHPLGAGRHRAPLRLGVRAADLQPGAADRQRRPARAPRCCRCAGRTTSRARPTTARCRTPSPTTGTVSDEAVASAFEQRWGVKMKREPGMKIPEMFDAAVEGRLKAMYIFGEDVAQTDPDTAHVDARARVARLPRLPGHLRERDDQVRRRDPAGVVLPREDRHVHERRAARAARRGGQRPARGGQDRLRDPHDGVARARLRHGLRDAQRRDGRDRRHDAALRRHQPRADRPQAGCSGRSPRTAPTRRSSTRRSSPCPAAAGQFAALPVQAARRPGRRRVPADPRHRPPPRALQRRHDDAPHGQPEPDEHATGSRCTPTTPPALGLRDGETCHGAQPPRARSSCRCRSRRASSRGTCSPRSTSPRCAPTC